MKWGSTMPRNETTSEFANVPRSEHPRPDFKRDEWMTLNGPWEFAFDNADYGMVEKWYTGPEGLQAMAPFTHTIMVPFAVESRLSGIADTGFHDVVWYRKAFEVPEAFAGKRIVLHFGAVDYRAVVWVNGQLAMSHEGGHTPFSGDITDLLVPADNTIVVRAEDAVRDLAQPRGKQYWASKSTGIFYTRTTGIWQSVWLEAVASVYIESAKFTPDIDNGEVEVEVKVHASHHALADSVRAAQFHQPEQPHYHLQIEIRFSGELISQDRLLVTERVLVRRIGLTDFKVHRTGKLWSPEHPHLYDVTLWLYKTSPVPEIRTAPSLVNVTTPEQLHAPAPELLHARASEPLDTVQTYFGMRKIAVAQGKVLLNNHPYYMKLILDQGYFPDGILTPPSDDDIRRDVELTKQMGFNGVRKHQKIEDPRFLYWCDRLGLMVWGEMANTYLFSADAVRRITSEFQEMVHRDYNHPSIVAWVPINESWGVPRLLSDPRQAAHLASLYYLAKSLDTTRLVISNDGWEHAISDLLTIHDYESAGDVLRERYAAVESTLAGMPSERFLYSPGFSYRGEPIYVTEFGGIAFKTGDGEGWGYSGASDEQDFIERFRAVIEAMHQSPIIQGYCYTQLTDVEQEMNGLLTYQRKPKVPLEVIHGIVKGKR